VTRPRQVFATGAPRFVTASPAGSSEVILREMPATWDPSFRPSFYTRWGRENCVISARTRRCEYPQFRQRLSIKAAWGGREDYLVDHSSGRRRRRFVPHHERGTHLRQRSPLTRVDHVVLDFLPQPNMASDVLHALTFIPPNACSRPLLRRAPRTSNFPSGCGRNDRVVSPVLKFHPPITSKPASMMRRRYEEQLFFLLTRNARAASERCGHRGPSGGIEACDAPRAVPPRGTRDGFHPHTLRKADWARGDRPPQRSYRPIIACAYSKRCKDAAPREFLARKRMRGWRCACCAASSLPLHEVAALVGFQSRSTLFRKLRTSGEGDDRRRMEVLHAQEAQHDE